MAMGSLHTPASGKRSLPCRLTCCPDPKCNAAAPLFCEAWTTKPFLAISNQICERVDRLDAGSDAVGAAVQAMRSVRGFLQNMHPDQETCFQDLGVRPRNQFSNVTDAILNTGYVQYCCFVSHAFATSFQAGLPPPLVPMPARSGSGPAGCPWSPPRCACLH